MTVTVAVAIDTGASAGAATLHLEVPPGFTARQSTPDGGSEVGYEVASKADPDTGCQVDFAFAASETRDQSRINADAETPGYAARIKAELADAFDVTSVDRFLLQGAEGAVAIGDPKVGQGSIRSVIYVVDTPRGRLDIKCVAAADEFDAWRPIFERIARGVTLPH